MGATPIRLIQFGSAVVGAQLSSHDAEMMAI